ncbi:hypothetical protein [Kineosporia sp. R_H_3]|uniref:hypothetical protein n=1 Tax=Kineosporia sp. R_H_3 TaxID=1961848 RepID=UPI000B4AA677|nr:hypothetical protein [Kineosporia sp. R_H_3]
MVTSLHSGLLTGLHGGLLAVDPEGPNADKVSPGLLGFVTVFCLALAVVVLVRSMAKHLRKVRYSPDPDGRMWTPPGTVGLPSAEQPAAAEAPPTDGGRPPSAPAAP